MGRVYSADVSVFSVASTSLLALLKDCSIRSSFDLVDGKPLTRLGKSGHMVKKGLSVEYSNFSTVSQPQRVTNINVTVFSVAGTDYIATCRSGSIAGEFTHVEGSGISDVWKSPYVTEKDYKIRGEFQLVDSATANVWQNNADEIFASNLTGVNVTVSVTINGVAITLPCVVASAEWNAPEGGLQTVTLELQGRSPDSGDFPTAPTGNTSLLEKVIVEPQTARAISITNAGGATAYEVNLAGNAVIQSFNIDFNDGAIVMERYTWASQGAFVATV